MERPLAVPTTRLWGMNLARLDPDGAVKAIDGLVRRREPSYFITANLNYAMLSAREPDLRAVNDQAALVLADGMPLVWASRKTPAPLPCRVTGADLFVRLCGLAASSGYSVFFLGGQPGVPEEAARRLQSRFLGLRVAGVETPPFRPLSDEETARLLARVRGARPDILFVCFGQPKGERWIARNYRELGVPVCAQMGASVDFAAGRVPRAPAALQAAGLEWAYRLWREPARLVGRYARNAGFYLRTPATPTEGRDGGGR